MAALWQELLAEEEQFLVEQQERAKLARQKRVSFALNQLSQDTDLGYYTKTNTNNSNNNNRDSRDSRGNSRNNKGRGSKDNNALHYAALLPERFYTDLVSLIIMPFLFATIFISVCTSSLKFGFCRECNPFCQISPLLFSFVTIFIFFPCR